MAIQLKPPAPYGYDQPSTNWSTADPMAGYSNLQWAQSAPYYNEQINRVTAPNPIGSVAGDRSLQQMSDLLAPDARRYTTIAPPSPLSSPILGNLGAGPGERSKLGSFTLNEIDPFSSAYEWTGRNINAPEEPLSAGQPGNPLDYLAKGDIGGALRATAESFMQIRPTELVDKAAALGLVLSGHQDLLPYLAKQDAAGAAVYPFQKDPAYWDWLRSATAEQMAQQAKSVANQYIGASRNEPLYNTLLDRFRQDQGSLTALTSGSPEVDYVAKKQAYTDYLGEQRGSILYAKDPVSNLWGGLAYMAGLVPFIGAPLQSFIDPLTPEEEAYWQGLNPTKRTSLLADTGLNRTLAQLGVALPIFSGISEVGTAAKASSSPTIAAMGQAYAISLRTMNILMATGFVSGIAGWTMETTNWFDSRELGKQINTAAPISGSLLAVPLDQIGYFSSGTFGAALAFRTAARGAGVAGAFADARVLGGALSQAVGPVEVPYFSGVYRGGWMVDSLHEGAGIDPQRSRFAFTDSLLSYLLGSSNRATQSLAADLIAGRPTGNALFDNMAAAERVAEGERMMMSSYSSGPARVVQMVNRLARVRQAAPLLGTSESELASVADRIGMRNLVNEAEVGHKTDYGADYFGADLGSIRAYFQKTLTDLGDAPRMDYFDARFGTKENVPTVDTWTAAARAAKQIAFASKGAELHDIFVADPTLTEARPTLFSQRTLSMQDIEHSIPILTGADVAVARAEAERLIRSKDRVGEAYVLGQLADASQQPGTLDVRTVDPVKLAEHLQAIYEQGGAPRLRNVVDPSSPTANLTLNRFHARLVAQGEWNLGYREKGLLPQNVRFTGLLNQELSAFEFAAREPLLVTMADVRPGEIPEGYIELPAGTRIRRYNWYALEPIRTTDGRFLVKDDGTLQAAMAGAAPTAAGGADRYTNDPANPQPIDQYSPDWQRLPEAQKKLTRDISADFAHFDPDLQGVFSSDLHATGQVFKGRNAGAEWPVLRHDVTGEKYLFKARRSSSGLVDLSDARRLAGPTATRLMASLGLHTAEEIPFRFGTIQGTLQKVLEVTDVIDLSRPHAYDAATRAELVKHHIADWLTSQLDSNSDSFLVASDGFVYGIDKGQAFKYVNKDGIGIGVDNDLMAMADGEEFWVFRTVDAADTHLGEYLHKAVESGKMDLNWSDVEELIGKIEALPEDVFLGSMKELAEARVADGRFESNVQEFYDNMLERKRNIRSWTANAFHELGYASLDPAMPHWRPGEKGTVDLGTPIRLNEPPLDLKTLYDYNDAQGIPEPPAPPTTDHYKAGVVIAEPDGRVWILNPKGNFGGYTFTWPKGKVEAGKEPFQHAAIREAFEETGLSVRITKHLADVPNDAGNITRYYVAERVAGGPAHIGTPDEVGSVALVHGRDAGQYLFRHGTPDPRDQAVLDAFHGKAAAAETEAQLAPDTMDVTPEGPAAAEGSVDPANELYGYVGHVRLRNGTLWRSPWLDATFHEHSQVELGNRGILGRAFDNVFRGWRSWRIMEAQKAQLHFEMNRRFPSFTVDQVALFHQKLLGIQREAEGISIQALAGMGHIPVMNHWAKEIRAAGEEVFGPGPHLGRDGRYHEMDWNRMVVQSYRQSTRLNVLAGVTSHIKAIPGLGEAVLVTADLLYPILRFGISPLFKLGEVVESAALNAMRGTFLSGDPFMDALWWRAGMGTSRSVLLADVNAEPMIAGMTRTAGLTGIDPVNSERARYGTDPAFFDRVDAAIQAKRVASVLAPRSTVGPVSTSSLRESLSGNRLEMADPVKFPDFIDPAAARQVPGLFEHREDPTDPTASQSILSGGDKTARQVSRYLDQAVAQMHVTALGDEAAQAKLGAGIAFLKSLPPGYVERLAEAVPLTHTPVTRSGDSSTQIGYIEAAIANGHPMFSGMLSTGLYELLVKEAQAGGVVTEAKMVGGADTSISPGEQFAGFADAKYGSAASMYDVGNGRLMTILKPEAARHSITLNTDRIQYASGYGFDTLAAREAVMTPAAVQAITRIEIQKLLMRWGSERPDLSLVEFLAKEGEAAFSSTAPFEFAYLNGINFDDVAAMLVPATHVAEWEALVDKYKDHPEGKALGDIKIVPYDVTKSSYNTLQGDHRPAMWADALERAGLTDLALSYPDIPSHAEALMSIPSASVSPGMLATYGSGGASAIRNAAGDLGIKADTVQSNADIATVALQRTVLEARSARQTLETSITSQKQWSAFDRAAAADNVRRLDEQAVEIDQLRTDIAALHASAGYGSMAEAIADGSPAAIAWMDRASAIEARMQALGMTPDGTWRPVGEVAVKWAADGKELGRFEIEIPREVTDKPTTHAGYTPPYDQHVQIAEIKALLETYQHEVPSGYIARSSGLVTPASARWLSMAIDTPQLRDAIKARARAKTGHDPVGDPVIRAYLRGTGKSVRTGGDGELVVTIQDATGQAYGNLTLAELEELWMKYGYPADFAERAAAVGYDAEEAGPLQDPSHPNPYPDGHMLWGSGDGGAGRMYFWSARRGPGRGRGAEFVEGPLGHDFVDVNKTANGQWDVRILQNFEPRGQSYTDMATAATVVHNDIVVSSHNNSTRVSLQDSRGDMMWAYDLHPGKGDALEAKIVEASRTSDLIPALRDLFDRAAGRMNETTHSVLLELDRTSGYGNEVNQVAAFERLAVRGEVPPWIVAIDKSTAEVIDHSTLRRDLGSEAVEAHLPEPVALDFTEVPHTPERFGVALREKLESLGAKGRRAVDGIWNPIPYKQRQMDRLIFKLVRDYFAPLLKIEVPAAYKIFNDLKVPDGKMADFLVADRALASRFKDTGSRADWEALVQHANQYLGKGALETERLGLEELYASPEFDVMLETWRLALKAAEDESYGVHFFSPYRSTFERSINHPIFGIYPASWSFKVAKEWYRFLYQNTTLGIRLGMAPAKILQNLTQAQAVAWAKANPEDLDAFLEDGPLSSTLFIFNLLLPGDWSSIPFPLSRTVRDLARGNTNMYDLFVRNMTSMGVGRDIRLGGESIGELRHLISGDTGGEAYDNAYSVRNADDLPGGLPTLERAANYARAESVRGYYTYR